MRQWVNALLPGQTFAVASLFIITDDSSRQTSQFTTDQHRTTHTRTYPQFNPQSVVTCTWTSCSKSTTLRTFSLDAGRRVHASPRTIRVAFVYKLKLLAKLCRMAVQL